MKNCPHCHKSIEDTLTTCSFCQGTITEIIPAKKYTPIFSLKELLSLLGIGVFLGVAHNYLLNSYTPLLAAWDSTLPTLTTF